MNINIELLVLFYFYCLYTTQNKEGWRKNKAIGIVSSFFFYILIYWLLYLAANNVYTTTHIINLWQYRQDNHIRPEKLEICEKKADSDERAFRLCSCVQWQIKSKKLYFWCSIIFCRASSLHLNHFWVSDILLVNFKAAALPNSMKLMFCAP